ncbi:MAG: peptidoglycan -binding protein [Pseudolabrys sp.]|nr:peptidoglycan -binding protein [Pseudolabrys sp.]
MALARSRRAEGVMNYWPGFVDALSTLILGIIFLLTVFVVVQFYLQAEVAGKDTALSKLSQQLAELSQLFAVEKAAKSDLEQQLAQVRTGLAAAEGERARFKGLYEGAGINLKEQEAKISQLSGQLEGQKPITDRALAQVELMNQQIAAMRRQLAALEEALNASEQKDKESQARIADLGQRLNLALAEKVQELNRYRSDFFGRLREILGNRPDIRIVGDRFVLPAELLFETGKAELLPAAKIEIDKIAAAILELTSKIPADIGWVLRVDGHTDVRPIAGPVFKSNWDLSSARAIAVVQYLASKSIPPQRLVAAGFGEYQPIDDGKTEDAYRRNRRIEFKLTER